LLCWWIGSVLHPNRKWQCGKKLQDVHCVCVPYIFRRHVYWLLLHMSCLELFTPQIWCCTPSHHEIHACAVRFCVTENLKKFLAFGRN
jgi:hypothetical protein